MNDSRIPFEQHLLQLKDHEQEVFWIDGKAFIIMPATLEDIERINKGYFCMD
ncbi:hypothetical protein [Paenibacillus foliorum]|uniref:hypothetical protein n=1 Tax=Paenibacillus foliorum TaxID=2654974 RepID=UPI0014922AF8|nr:hypothetical protein [Paenibacillus foliorum]